MKPMIFGMPLALMQQIPELDNLTKAVERQKDRTAFAQLVVKNLGNPAALLAAVAAHKPGKAKTTQQNSRRLQALLRGVQLPPSKPRNVTTPTRL